MLAGAYAHDKTLDHLIIIAVIRMFISVKQRCSQGQNVRGQGQRLEKFQGQGATF